MSASNSAAEQLSPWLEALDHPSKAHQIALRWKATGGTAHLSLFHDALDQLGIGGNVVSQDLATPWFEQAITAPINTIESLEAAVPYGFFEQITGGAIRLDLPLSLSANGRTVSSNYLVIQPIDSQDPHLRLVAQNAKAQTLFELDHIHVSTDAKAGLLSLENIDVRVSPWLAEQLGIPMMKGLVIGKLDMVTHVSIPSTAMTELPQGLQRCENPIWPPIDDVDVDVSLIAMTVQWRRNLPNNQVVYAPSATLKNVGLADVVWQEKFGDPIGPYNNDQHPYLTWAMYREIDNRFEQIGRSGVKHAFATVNTNCTCPLGNILWPNCEDVYGVNTNDNGSVLGPREEIEAFTGVWESTGSFFDPAGTGTQTRSSNGTDENRMVVDTDKLNEVGANYFVSSWYTVRDDINIFNTMGYRQYAPELVGQIWDLSPVQSFRNGPALDAYVAPGTNTPLETVQRLGTNAGHLAVAVKVTDFGNGLYRYNYAVDNYDFDPMLSQFRLPLSAASQFSDFVFVDVDSDPANDWAASRVSDELVISAPTDNAQDWGTLFSFSFTTSVAPVTGPFSLISPAAADAEMAEVRVPAMGVDNELLFRDDFEG